jgi:AcrR family transcriptional regulator
MASTPPAARSAGEIRREEIIAQAIDVFGEYGFAGARIDEVARRVGIRRSSILYHFPDKLALYSAAIGDVLGALAERIEIAQVSPQEPLESIADAWVDFIMERPISARLLLRQMIDTNPTPVPNADLPTTQLIRSIQTAIEEQAGPAAAKSLDVAEFSLVLASTSLVWVASQSAVEGAFGLDTLSPTAIRRHRQMLHALTRQLISASQDDSDRLDSSTQ